MLTVFFHERRDPHAHSSETFQIFSNFKVEAKNITRLTRFHRTSQVSVHSKQISLIRKLHANIVQRSAAASDTTTELLQMRTVKSRQRKRVH